MTVIRNGDTDGDLQAVPVAVEDAPGTPVSAEPFPVDLALASSRELGQIALRLIETLSRRADETAAAELQRLDESLRAVIGRSR